MDRLPLPQEGSRTRPFVGPLAVGSLPPANAGEWVTAEGRWVHDREFGLHFKAEMLTTTAPTTREGIEKYLGSGMAKGIGPVYAKKLVDRFGDQIFVQGAVRWKPAGSHLNI